MAVARASTDFYVRRGTDVPSNTTVTMMMWVNPTSNGTVFWYGAGGGARYWLSGETGTGDEWWLFANSGAYLTGISRSAGWQHVAMTVAGTGATDGKLYVNGSLAGSGQPSGTVTGTYIAYGDDGSWDASAMAGGYAHFKVWNAILTEAEIAQEMRTVRPVRFTDLKAWLPLFTTNLYATDYSGLGNFGTLSGTQPTTTDGPPVGWGASPMLIGGEPVAPTIIYIPGYYV